MAVDAVGAGGEALREWWQRAILAPLVRARFSLRVEARLELAALPAPCIFAANHRSHLDSLAVLAALPDALRRRVRIAAAEDYWFRSPPRRAVAAAIGAFPFPRRGVAGIERSAALLAAGRSVLLYPAGTRGTGEGGGFRGGVGLLACWSGRPVVPVAILGTERVWPKGRRLPGRGALTVRFGAPLRFAPGLPAKAVARQIELLVRDLGAGGSGGDAVPPPAGVPLLGSPR